MGDRGRTFRANYDMARSVFARRWPDVEASPGGLPPSIASLAKTRIQKVGDAVNIETAARIRNLRGERASVILVLCGKHGENPPGG
jgi:hypothetical protein